MHREGYPFVIAGVIITLLAMALHATLGWACVAITLGIYFFFRDPERVTPDTPGIIVSPADGRVKSVELNVIPPEDAGLGEEPHTRIHLFLSVIDVHVNRIPIGGKIIHRSYHPGAFLSATTDKSSELNERNSLVVETGVGNRIGFVQIAGLIARRIVCDIAEGNTVSTGERYGIIRFGSAMHIYIPSDVVVDVLPGQLVIGGETVLARLGHFIP